MTLDEKFDIVQFERQAKASAMIQTLLDFWESGHEEVPGLTREFVQETIEYAAGVDDGVKDTIVAGYEFYAGGQQQLLESILGNHSRQSRQNIIRFLPDDAPKQVIGELDDLVYLLPLVKISFDDFFAEGNGDARYNHGNNLGMPFSVEAILVGYSLNEHRRVSVGTARRLYFRLDTLPEDEKKKAVEELLTRIGYAEIFKEYSRSRIYFFSDEVALVKSVFDDFFKEGNENARYRRGGNLGTPYSVEGILGHYSLQVHQMVSNGTARKLYNRLHKMPEAQRKTVVEELLRKTGYTEIIKTHSKSRIYFFSDEIALTKSVFDDFFKDGNEDVWYSRSNNLGTPFSVEAILCRYSLQEHGMVVMGTANKLYKRLYLMSDTEKTAAITDLLEKTGYTEIFEQYLQSNRNNPFVPPPVEIQQPCTAPLTP